MRYLNAVPAALALVSVLSFAPAADGAAASRPLDELVAARGALRVLAGQARSSAARQAVVAAEADVGRSTMPTLWQDRGHVVAPSYGVSVFSGSRAALVALEHAPAAALPSRAVAGVEAQILASDRTLAEGAILQARGGTGGLLARARGMILSGDRWAQTSRLDLAAEQYGAGWKDAFQALTDLVVQRATSVPPATLGTAARNALRGSAAIAPAGVRFIRGRRALTALGKPEILFVGTESCRFCAVERWGLVVALSRFGTFSSLHLSQSETTAPPVVRSFTFAGARYRSPYLSLVAVELSGEMPRGGGGFASLGRLTAPERSLFGALDPKGLVPFVDVANRARDIGATVSAGLVAGSSWSALASSLRHTRKPSGQAIAATAEVLTAEICRATAGAPSSVCGTPAVQEYSSRLARFGSPGSGCPVKSEATRPAVVRGRRSR